jgi:4-aminobutyrate aminotransferase-like enzyme
VASAFDTGMEYFSTFGGSSAACAAGLATLRVTLDERLMEHAHAVGEHLLTALRELQQRHPLVGNVRGSGLFLGVELVSSRQARVPAPAEAAFVVNRMRELGVLTGTDGPDHNVIKIRGPMPLTTKDGDLLVGALNRALGEAAC